MGNTLLQFNKKAEEIKEKAVTEAAEGTTVSTSSIKTTEYLKQCLDEVIKTVLPPKTLQTQYKSCKE